MSSEDAGLRDLERVDAEEVIIRLIHPVHFNWEHEEVAPAALPMKQFRPQCEDSGPSFYVRSGLTSGVQDLEATEPKWKGFGVAEIKVQDLLDLGLDIRLTPEECRFPTIKHAHASIVSTVDRATRDAVVDLLNSEGRLTRPPERRS